ncbi:MAG TPA: sigma-70 family RNA polymerase sigma factor [Verrucomicrobiota bacterium]|nr:sigma-70 family RNA polymerase sigma factor [Verrucomicrobiota bacterium]
MPGPLFDPIATRHSLLERLKDWGDQTGWHEFFDSYGQLIYNVAVKAGLTDAEAQEVVQETVIAVARTIGEFKANPARGSFSAWLMKQTRWRIADQWRKRRSPVSAAWDPGRARRVEDEADSTDPLERLPDPALDLALEGAWEQEWESHLMTLALERVKRQVSPRQFQMFDLHALQKLSVQDTARTLKASVASVYMARYRITRLVKQELSALINEGR